uniref:Uncharacterized protein n=1 Tax=Picea glauca TaxID=3330 RepID=A0A101M0C0_PICGL|nr:hypothetical protein ABT39_MTgene4602 [Picea glauca]
MALTSLSYGLLSLYTMLVRTMFYCLPQIMTCRSASTPPSIPRSEG